ncbi:hypothetical protein EBB07_24190 [Paenibacillaceae bacterium]|nr:hypothetical protein EBB07_24190 [Paenibacillaceae bacterium]
MGSFRWDRNELEGDFLYKVDRWTSQPWVEFYPPMAIGYIYIPLLNRTELTIEEVEEYVQKYALSGWIIETWIKRTRFTDLYTATWVLLILLFVITLLRSRRAPRGNQWLTL